MPFPLSVTIYPSSKHPEFKEEILGECEVRETFKVPNVGIIAGAYVNKSNADRQCIQLKSKGCDAYIINRYGMYYVSMGSAASRTEIEAKYDHIKEWYKGDVTIKKW